MSNLLLTLARARTLWPVTSLCNISIKQVIFHRSQISLPSQTDNICSGSPSDPPYIKQVLALPDRIFFNTPNGLHEAFGRYQDFNEITDAVGTVLNSPARCYKQLMVPTQSKAAKVYVLAIGESGYKHQAFAAHVLSGLYQISTFHT